MFGGGLPMSLFDDLEEAEGANPHSSGPCSLCDALGRMEPEAADRVRAVVGGRTIGTEKLAAILNKNGFPTGRRAIMRHQKENHSD